MSQFELAKFADYLLEYNKLTEECFSKCIRDMNNRTIASNEESCLNLCIGKNLNVKNKIIFVYQEVQQQMMQQRANELTKQMNQIAEANDEANNNENSPSLVQSESNSDTN